MLLIQPKEHLPGSTESMPGPGPWGPYGPVLPHLAPKFQILFARVPKGAPFLMSPFLTTTPECSLLMVRIGRPPSHPQSGESSTLRKATIVSS